MLRRVLIYPSLTAMLLDRPIRYLRLKYPTVVDMALAASAPIKLDSVGLVDPLQYYKVVTDA